MNAKYEDPSAIKAAELPALEPLHVLVKSDEFDRAEDIPDNGENRGPITGILYEYDELSEDDQELARMVSPSATNAVVLQLGRAPRPFALAVGMLVLGVGLMGAAIMLFFRSGRESE